MIFKYEICDSCETVQHCRAFGCVPLQPQQEPVAIVAVDGIGQIQVGWLKKPQHNDKLYTQPPAQRQPLTEREINDICPQFEDPMRREMWITGFKVAHNIRN